MEKMTLAAACQWAKAHDYNYITDSAFPLTMSIDDFLSEMSRYDNDPEDYIVFPPFIVRASDAWKEPAEIYRLDC